MLAETLSVVAVPRSIVTLAGCAKIDGAVQVGAVTVTAAAALFTLPQLFVTRTQYVVDADGVTLIDAPVAPEIGEVVVPLGPMYH